MTVLITITNVFNTRWVFLREGKIDKNINQQMAIELGSSP